MSATLERPNPLPNTGPRADQTRALQDVGGLEITGVDLSQPLTEERRDWLLRTFRAHPILVFRDQSLTKQQQYDFQFQFP